MVANAKVDKKEINLLVIDPKAIVFDPEKVTMFDIEDVAEAERGMRYRDALRIMLKAVVSIPREFGDPKDISSFSHLRKAEWKVLVSAYIRAVSDPGE